MHSRTLNTGHKNGLRRGRPTHRLTHAQLCYSRLVFEVVSLAVASGSFPFVTLNAIR